jgi:hypothetical protein
MKLHVVISWKQYEIEIYYIFGSLKNGSLEYTTNKVGQSHFKYEGRYHVMNIGHEEHVNIF